MGKDKILSFVLPFVLIFLSIFCNKNNNLLEIPLRINNEFIQSAHTAWVNFDIAEEIKLKFTLRENMKIGFAPGNVLVSAVKTKEIPPSLMIKPMFDSSRHFFRHSVLLNSIFSLKIMSNTEKVVGTHYIN